MFHMRTEYWAHAMSENEHSLQHALDQGTYQGYAYGYPHKTAYRWFDSPLRLRDLWRDQHTTQSFLYLHIPFCEMRCGFCNLFTTTNPTEDREDHFLGALTRQALIVRKELPPDFAVSRIAIGGGTPTLLRPANLELVLALIIDTFQADAHQVPASIESSPDTATADRISVLNDFGISRVSMGIQSWFPDELRAMGRPQDVAAAHLAVDRLRNASFATLSLDLIYGVEGQTTESMRRNVQMTLAHEPDEVFLYPLYVRPLTGLGRQTKREWDDCRLNLYRAARAELLENGFRQISMRMFSRSKSVSRVEYDCQSDPMVGLGPGARSYSSSVHYSSDWAVSRARVTGIIDSFIEATDEYHQHAHYGVTLTPEDRKIRFVLQGLLHETGLDFTRFRRAFDADPLVDFPQLDELLRDGYAQISGSIMRLTEAGLEHSDAIGPWLYAPQVKQQMQNFDVT
jgi:oxygen-independent coproporphyrinogen III oxidase